MKKALVALILIGALIGVLFTWWPPSVPANQLNHVAFGQLPVLVGGRIKPLDTVARATLLQFQGRQRVTLANGTTLTPSQWIADVLLADRRAHDYQVFEIVNPELLALLNLSTEQGQATKRFSYKQLGPGLDQLDQQARLAAPINAQKRTAFQRAVLALHTNVGLFVCLQASLVPPDLEDPLEQLTEFEKTLPDAITAVRQQQNGEKHDEALATRTIELANRFQFMAESAHLIAIPPADTDPDETHWRRTGQVLLETFQNGGLQRHAFSYAGLAQAWRSGQVTEFNEVVRLLQAELTERYPDRLFKAHVETRFKAAAPFYTGIILFVAAFLCAIFSWLRWPDFFGPTAWGLLLIAFLLTMIGIALRMWLEGRPPVTNLYSSALFVAWGAVGFCIILERLYPSGLASAAGGAIGLAGLIIAHHLSLSGDTLEMMRAVLDSNFWLATHVVTITLGYSATFLAGFLAILYLILGPATPILDQFTGGNTATPTPNAPTNGRVLLGMVYGILCFATLFSLVGTILGGIWADQSWGRFWGWDPKENGALIIVLWNALILHVRWGRLASPRGFMALAVFGNIVTSWSWFGTNLLGVGLHSYGFTDRGAIALILFVLFNLTIIAFPYFFSVWRSANARTLSLKP